MERKTQQQLMNAIKGKSIIHDRAYIIDSIKNADSFVSKIIFLEMGSKTDNSYVKNRITVFYNKNKHVTNISIS